MYQTKIGSVIEYNQENGTKWNIKQIEWSSKGFNFKTKKNDQFKAM